MADSSTSIKEKQEQQEQLKTNLMSLNSDILRSILRYCPRKEVKAIALTCKEGNIVSNQIVQDRLNRRIIRDRSLENKNKNTVKFVTATFNDLPSQNILAVPGVLISCGGIPEPTRDDAGYHGLMAAKCGNIFIPFFLTQSEFSYFNNFCNYEEEHEHDYDHIFRLAEGIYSQLHENTRLHLGAGVIALHNDKSHLFDLAPLYVKPDFIELILDLTLTKLTTVYNNHQKKNKLNGVDIDDDITHYYNAFIEVLEGFLNDPFKSGGNGKKTTMYNGKKYKIKNGSRGGKYIDVDGKKHYLK